VPSATGSSLNIDIKIGGAEVPDAEVISFVVEQDLGQPDMAVITLSNSNHAQTIKNTIGQGKPVEIAVHEPPIVIFKGEVVGIEPVYKPGGQNVCIIRAFNKMHRMLRGRKSKTFQGPKVKNILETICQGSGLTLDASPEADAEVKHFYQHNQTDLDVVRQLGARLGCSVWCVDTKLFFKKPDLDTFSGIWFQLSVDNTAENDHQMQWFSPRMSSAEVVKEVIVNSWDPEKKELITGQAAAENSRLGSDNASAASRDAGGDGKTFVVDHPVPDRATADAIAKAKLAERMMSYIVGELGVNGKADYKVGIVVGVEVNKDEPNDAFNGRYFVNGCTHKYSRVQGAQKGGYNTVMRVTRNAEFYHSDDRNRG
jgi:phage protein D